MRLPARIGLITTSYPRFPGDFAGSFVAAHVHALTAAGVAVDVIAAGDPDPRDARVTRVAAPPGLFYAGGAPDALDAHRASPGAAAGFTARLTAAVVRRAPRWDAVIAHWLAPSAIAALPTRGPLLAIAHGGDVHLLLRTRLIVPVIAALALRRARIAFVSAELAARTAAALPAPLARWLARNAIVQPMGVDLARFARIAAPSQAARAAPTIAVLARLVPIKGVDVVIDAMAALVTPARLVIAGAGPDAAALAARAADVTARTGHAIELAGELDADARDRLLADAAIVVVPSRPAAHARVEGAPLAAIEALAAGRPVIAAATGGLAELPLPVRLVAPDDPRALASAIQATLDTPPSPASCRAAATDRDWPDVVSRLHRHWLAAQ